MWISNNTSNPSMQKLELKKKRSLEQNLYFYDRNEQQKKEYILEIKMILYYFTTGQVIFVFYFIQLKFNYIFLFLIYKIILYIFFIVACLISDPKDKLITRSYDVFT